LDENEDRLTRLKDERVLRERLPIELMRAASYEHVLSLLLIRVEVPSNWRAAAFYPLLKGVARKVRQNVRAIDFAVRLGDDVVLMLAETPGAGAKRLGEKLTEVVDSSEFDIGLDLAVVRPLLRFATATFPEDAAEADALIAAVRAKIDAPEEVVADEPAL